MEGYSKGGFDRALDCSGAKYNKTYNKKGEQTGEKSYKYKESVQIYFIDLNNDI